MTTNIRRELRCPCRKGVMLEAMVDREMQMKYDGSVHTVLVKRMPVLACSACEELQLNNDSDVAALRALREHLSLLQPEAIKASREELGLSQEALASRLGCASESVSRWETGSVVQSRVYDRFLRVFIRFSEVRNYLMQPVEEVPARSILRKELEAPSDIGNEQLWSELIKAVSDNRFYGQPDAKESVPPRTATPARVTGWTWSRSHPVEPAVLRHTASTADDVEYAEAA